MKKLLTVVVLLVLAVGIVFLYVSDPAYTNLPPLAGKAWVAFGDSLTAGYGASEGNDYPTLLGKRLGVPILNAGTPGATSQDAVARLEEVRRAEPKVVLLCFGGNDTLNSVPHQQTFRNLSQVIDQLHADGTFVVLIGIRSASIRDKYSSEFKELAKRKKVLYVPNMLAGPGIRGDRGATGENPAPIFA
jgi:lysophospholipase L1-like esterase